MSDSARNNIAAALGLFNGAVQQTQTTDRPTSTSAPTGANAILQNAAALAAQAAGIAPRPKQQTQQTQAQDVHTVRNWVVGGVTVGALVGGILYIVLRK